MFSKNRRATCSQICSWASTWQKQILFIAFSSGLLLDGPWQCDCSNLHSELDWDVIPSDHRSVCICILFISAQGLYLEAGCCTYINESSITIMCLIDSLNLNLTIFTLSLYLLMRHKLDLLKWHITGSRTCRADDMFSQEKRSFRRLRLVGSRPTTLGLVIL